MAVWVSKSRSIANLLERRIGLLTILDGRCKGSLLHSRIARDFSSKPPPEFSTKSADLFATSQRFKSTKTGEQIELPSSDEDDGENHLRSYSRNKTASCSTINKQNFLFYALNLKMTIFCSGSGSSAWTINYPSFSYLVTKRIMEPRKALDFPGGRVAFTSQMNFISESAGNRIPCYRVLDDDGYPIAGSIFDQVSKEVSVRMYSSMITLQIMDNIFYETQRQGRISFYLTSNGEEAINIASAAALTPEDVVLPQYREPGVLLWRGFTLQEFANQCFGNNADYGKGRQMPIHYGSQRHNYFTISSPIATQLPQAAGVAYSLKMDKKDACVVTYMGDGGTSEGDFHAALNFAAVMEVPVVFICRNNGWAISTPITEQFRSDGVVVKGQAYGIRSIRVDGNDALAVYSSTHTAREMAISEQRPILIEALTYRAGHHSTSDDSTKYRAVDEIEHWRTARNPVARFREWIQRNGWWSDEDESEHRGNIRKQLLKAIQLADRTEKPPLADLFSDVYEERAPNLLEQERSLRETIKKHPQDYPSDVPL